MWKKGSCLLAAMLCMVLCGMISSASAAEDEWLVLEENEYCWNCGSDTLTVYYNEGGHREVCQNCQYIANKEHTARCSEPSTCQKCKLTGITVMSWNLWHDSEYTYTYDQSSHQAFCGICKEVIETAPHYAYCTAPTVCSTCSAENIVPQNVYHAKQIMEYDETHHYSICQDCGELDWKGEHKALCSSPDKCNTCEATGLSLDEENIQHYNARRGYNATHHYEHCGGCGEQLWSDTHWGYCSDEDTCASCYAEGVTLGEIVHPYQTATRFDDTHIYYTCEECGVVLYDNEHIIVYTHDETHHLATCTYCSKGLKEEAHIAYCTSSATCYRCGAEGITPEELIHANQKNSYDETKHFSTCVDCGEVAYSNPHEAWCTSPTDCFKCDARNIVATYIHHGDEVYSYDEVEHFIACEDCGEVIQEAKHFSVCTESGAGCAGCGASNVTIDSIVHISLNSSSDALRHTVTCEDCGEVVVDEEHYVYCFAEEQICSYCDATDITLSPDSIMHIGTYQHDAQKHWAECEYCDYAESGPHEFTDGVCYCGFEQPASTRIPGDANGDGATDIMDALLVLQYDAGWSVNLIKENADVNADGVADIMDALLLLQYDAGWDVVLK